MLALNLDASFSVALGPSSEVGDESLNTLAALSNLTRLAAAPRPPARTPWVAFEAYHALEACSGPDARNCSGFAIGNATLRVPKCPQLSSDSLGHALWQVQPLLVAPSAANVGADVAFGFALLGELGKTVKLSSRRFTSLEVTTTTVEAVVLLARGEAIVVAALRVTLGGGDGAQSIARATCDAADADGVTSAFGHGDVDVVAQLTCGGGSNFQCTCARAAARASR